jgi:hypothetical protein
VLSAHLLSLYALQFGVKSAAHGRRRQETLLVAGFANWPSETQAPGVAIAQGKCGRDNTHHNNNSDDGKRLRRAKRMSIIRKQNKAIICQIGF